MRRHAVAPPPAAQQMLVQVDQANASSLAVEWVAVRVAIGHGTRL
jgi:hypothetical protein